MKKEPDIHEHNDVRLFDDLSAITRDGPQLDLIQRRVQQFILSFGRRPRILVCPTAPGARKQTVNHIGSILAQWGFDVDIGPIEKSPEQIARMALENDVHIIVIFCSKNLIHQETTELLSALKNLDATDILVAVFGPAPEFVKDSDSRSNRVGKADLMVFNPKSAKDVILMLDNLTRKN